MVVALSRIWTQEMSTLMWTELKQEPVTADAAQPGIVHVPASMRRYRGIVQIGEHEVEVDAIAMSADAARWCAAVALATEVLRNAANKIFSPVETPTTKKDDAPTDDGKQTKS